MERGPTSLLVMPIAALVTNVMNVLPRPFTLHVGSEVFIVTGPAMKMTKTIAIIGDDWVLNVARSVLALSVSVWTKKR